MNYYHPQTLEHIRNPLPGVADWAGSTELAPPAYDPQIESCRFIDGVWLVEVNAPPAPTIKEYQDAVQAMLDGKAREKNYDGILSLCSYVTSTNPTLAAEAAAGVAGRDAAWSTCYQALADVQNNLRPAPPVAELLAEIPAIVWP